jgi:Uma2 family endonuclease
MLSMSLRTTHGEVLDAGEHLPESATLVVPQFHWDDYELLLQALAERSRLRVSYDCGRLEILSPSNRHEKYARFFDFLVLAVCEARGLTLEALGHTTWKKRALGKGVEPDACYYIKNANRIIGKFELDLETDPPPDIAVEVDLTSGSLRKFSIYAALSVPEMWRYDGQTVRLYVLTDGKYEEAAVSTFLPDLTGQMLVEAIATSDREGQISALKAFRQRIQSPA